MSNVMQMPSSMPPVDIHQNNRMATEQGLLGALLVRMQNLEICDARGVKSEHFSHRWHRLIYDNVLRLSKEKASISITAVYDQIADKELREYVGKLMASVISANHDFVDGSADMIVNVFAKRDKLLQLADVLKYLLNNEAAFKDHPNWDDLMSAVDSEISAALDQTESPQHGGLSHVSDAIDDYWQQLNSEQAPAILSGIAPLDDIIGGFMPGDLTVVAGRPGMGKSALAATLCRNLADQGKHVAYYTLEMTGIQVMQRFIAMLTAISVERQRARDLTVNDMERIQNALNYMRERNLYLNDSTRLKTENIRNQIKRQIRKTGLDCVLIDYLGLLEVTKAENRTNEIAAITRELKSIAIDLQLPVFLFSQLNRGVEARNDKRPLLSDLRDSGAIEQDADRVLLLYREFYYAQAAEPKTEDFKTIAQYQDALADWQAKLLQIKNQAEIIVAKNRHGNGGTAKVTFDGLRSIFK